MDIKVRKLTGEDAETYVAFFDTTPHDDYNPEHTCYCVNWCSADHRALKEPDREERRAMAFSYVQNSVIKGYIALHGKQIIGWCNANTKADCCNCAGLLFAVPDLQRAVSEPGEKVKAVYCFTVAPEFQRQGVARALLRAVCKDAAAEGFDYAEAYLDKDPSKKWMQFMGFSELYKSEGFVLHAELKDAFVVRKELRTASGAEQQF